MSIASERGVVWNVIRYDVNRRCIDNYNIFDHGSFCKACSDICKKRCSTTRFEYGDDEFNDDIKSQLMYYYWAKCEWEVVVTSFPNGCDGKKIDVYWQVMQNWDIFLDFVRSHTEDLAYMYDGGDL